MAQDIRGTTVCDFCGHYGLIHAVGFYCLVDGCRCGHHPEERLHREYGGIGWPPSHCESCYDWWFWHHELPGWGVNDMPKENRETVMCKFCFGQCKAETAHFHQGQWVGDECCWDERLRTTE